MGKHLVGTLISVYAALKYVHVQSFWRCKVVSNGTEKMIPQ